MKMIRSLQIKIQESSSKIPKDSGVQGYKLPWKGTDAPIAKAQTPIVDAKSKVGSPVDVKRVLGAVRITTTD